MPRFHPAVVLPGDRPRPTAPPAVPPDPLAALSPAERERLPNLIGIGAAKCGTSALHAYLSEHPEIGMSAAKELKHFGTAHWLDRLPGYAAAFDPRFAVRGETSPTYAMDPFVPGVPEQIAAVLPDPRFVFMVADPVSRAAAHYRESRSLGFERRDMREAFADAGDPVNPYMAASRFGHQLSRYRDVFGPDRVLVIDQLDLRERRRETLRGVFEFAGVDPGFWSQAFEREPNAAADKIQPNRLGRFILDRAGRPRRRMRWVLIRGITASRIRHVELDDATRAVIADALREDVARFRQLTGRAFEHWSV